MTLIINVINDFSDKPYGRDENDGDFNGQEFKRRFLLEPLNEGKHVIVDLTGYNRYGPSFMEEAFGGLTRDNGFTPDRLKSILTIKHDELPSLVTMAWDYIEKGH